MFLPCPSWLRSAPSSVRPVPNIFLSIRKITERISINFAGSNHYHEPIKLLHFGRNWNKNNGAGYDRKFELTLIGFALTPNRC